MGEYTYIALSKDKPGNVGLAFKLNWLWERVVITGAKLKSKQIFGVS